ncbi:cation:proton antiporter [Maritalea sp.]|uniref:cation:proton antiporter n=1 Tax=Maritalea sp. TaxID=2003361 RepID=UPI003EF9C9AC
MTGPEFLEYSITVALGILTVALLLVIVRIVRGPTLPDRILALDMMVSVGIGYIAVIAIKTGYTLYLDIAISLGLVGFLATVAFARFVLQRWQIRENQTDAEATK